MKMMPALTFYKNKVMIRTVSFLLSFFVYKIRKLEKK